MNSLRAATRKRAVKIALYFGGAVFSILGFVGECDDMFVNATRIFDPCGTVFANCAPGSFEVNAAAVADYCVDPACTIPGQCGEVGPVLGTITDLCP